MALYNFTYLQKFSGVIRWADNTGSAISNTTLSDTGVTDIVWSADGDYFYTSSNYSTGRIEKWARGGTAYTWRHTGIDRTFVEMKADSSNNLYVASQDDIWILDEDDGTTLYSDIGSTMSGYSVYGIDLDSSGNAYVLAQENSYVDIVVFIFDNTLTYQSTVTLYTGYYGLPYVGTHTFARDTSGNYFVIDSYNTNLYKYNSSGTQQWSFTDGAIKFIIANSGKIYVLGVDTDDTVWRLTDNGSSYSEDWDSGSSLNGYLIGDIAVTSDEIYCFPESSSYDITALDESDGSALSGWTDIDVSNVILWGEIDPLLSVAASHFEVTEAIQYSRWVKTEGDIDCGHLETIDVPAVRGYGNELVDKLVLKNNYKTLSARYGYTSTVGDPPSEEWHWTYLTNQYGYESAVDIDGNMYIRKYSAYTAEEADEASDGYHTSAGSYWSIVKIDSEGDEVWQSKIVVGTLHDIKLASGHDPYVYARSSYTSVPILRYLRTTGVEDDSGNWPLTPLDTGDSIYTYCFTIGRDDKIYFIAFDNTDNLPYIHKYDLDGTTSTNWSTPMLLNQHATFGTQPNDCDANSSGELAVACVKVGDGGPQVHVYDSAKTLSWTYVTDPTNGVCQGILIDEDGDVYAPETYTGLHKIYSGGASGLAWTQASLSLFPGAFFSVDEDYIYYNDDKIDCSDGTTEYTLDQTTDTQIYFGAIHPLPSAAWAITVTFGSNGVVKTYNAESNEGGVELTSGDVVYAEAGKDFTFAFVGDSNGTDYYVDEVTVDSVNLGYRSEYTFENVLNNHTIYVTFGTGFPSGPFTLTYEMFGGILETIDVGASLSESYALRDPVLKWNITGGPLVETLAITGEGYLPWDVSLLLLINAERSDNAVASVTEHAWLVDGAEYTVADLIANGSVTLTAAQIMGQDGANYPYIYAAIVPAIMDESVTPQELFDLWMDDPPTAAIIIDDDYEEVGIYVENYDGDNYIAVVFAQWHPQYTVVRADASFDITYSLPTAYFFDYLSAESYATFLQDSASIKLPRYQAQIGDYQIPDLLSFTYRLKIGSPSYLSVNCRFTVDVFDEINSREDETFSISSLINHPGGTFENVVITSDLIEFSATSGESPKIIMNGYNDLQFYNSSSEITNVMTRVVDKDGKTRYRCSEPDFYLRPGSTVTYNGNEIVIAELVIFVTSGVSQYMEITEQ